MMEYRRIATGLWSEMPRELRRPVVTEWSAANKNGAAIDCFLEGPCPQPDGGLYLTDIPHGRILHVSAARQWRVVAEWDGEPNGLALHPDGRLFVADYKNGILVCDPVSGKVEPALGRRNSERFKGPNDLVFARNGDLYFTDQGQTGLHDPTGRVYRLRADGLLDCLLDNGPSPNGLVLDRDEGVLFVAMTRDNAIWRLPLLAQGGTAKVGRFASFHGASGPDGLAMDADANLYVAHASLGCVFVTDRHGEPLARLISCRGRTVTNVAFSKDGATLFMTESETGSVMQAASDSIAAAAVE